MKEKVNHGGPKSWKPLQRIYLFPKDDERSLKQGQLRNNTVRLFFEIRCTLGEVNGRPRWR